MMGIIRFHAKLTRERKNDDGRGAFQSIKEMQGEERGRSNTPGWMDGYNHAVKTKITCLKMAVEPVPRTVARSVLLKGTKKSDWERQDGLEVGHEFSNLYLQKKRRWSDGRAASTAGATTQMGSTREGSESKYHWLGGSGGISVEAK